MENLVAVELLRRRSYWCPGLEVYYWKDHAQREVDFVLKLGPEVRQLIQVTRASQKVDIAPRELDSLIHASEALRCKDLLVITWDYDGMLVRSGRKIAFRSLLRWLLDVQSLPGNRGPPSPLSRKLGTPNAVG